MAKKFQYLLDSAHELSRDMHNNLVRFVKNNGGFIDMRNTKHKDIPYGIVMDEYIDENRERRIIAVEVVEETELAVLFNSNVSYDTIEDMQEDEDNWYTIFGGQVLQNATLYNLCECIEQYV